MVLKNGIINTYSQDYIVFVVFVASYDVILSLESSLQSPAVGCAPRCQQFLNFKVLEKKDF